MPSEDNQHDYYVTVRDRSTQNRVQWRFRADSFAHAEEQAAPYVTGTDEIIGIEKDYTP